MHDTDETVRAGTDDTLLGTPGVTLGEPLARGASVGRYLIVERIGQGGMAVVWTGIGYQRATLGEHAHAIAAFEKALAIMEKSLGPDHVRLAGPLTAIGVAHLALGARARAIAPLERAHRLRAGKGDPGDQAETAFALARALWETGRDRPRALALAREARAHYAGSAATAKSETLAEVDRWLATR